MDMDTLLIDFNSFIFSRVEHIAKMLENDCEFEDTNIEIATLSDKALELAKDNFTLAERTAYTKGLFDGLELSRNFTNI